MRQNKPGKFTSLLFFPFIVLGQFISVPFASWSNKQKLRHSKGIKLFFWQIISCYGFKTKRFSLNWMKKDSVCYHQWSYHKVQHCFSFNNNSDISRALIGRLIFYDITSGSRHPRYRCLCTIQAYTVANKQLLLSFKVST